MHGLPTDAPTITDYSSLSPFSHDGCIKKCIVHHIPLHSLNNVLDSFIIPFTVYHGASWLIVPMHCKVWQGMVRDCWARTTRRAALNCWPRDLLTRWFSLGYIKNHGEFRYDIGSIPREPWSYEFVGHELKPRLFQPAWWIPQNPFFFKKHFPEGRKSLLVEIAPSQISKTSSGGSKDQDYGSLIGWNGR